MTNEITNLQLCIVMRSGHEVWVDNNKSGQLKNILLNITGSKFIELGDEMFNTADVVGIFNPKTMGDLIRRRKGEWQCKYGEWHGLKEICECGKNHIQNFEAPVLNSEEWEKAKQKKEELKEKLSI